MAKPTGPTPLPTPLEDVLRALAARGELNHVSLTPSRDGKMFRASFAMCSMFGISFAEDEDPAKAVYLACTTAKMKPQRIPKPNVTIDTKATRLAENVPVVEVEDPAADLM